MPGCLAGPGPLRWEVGDEGGAHQACGELKGASGLWSVDRCGPASVSLGSGPGPWGSAPQGRDGSWLNNVPSKSPCLGVCVSEPCLRVSYTRLQQIPGSSLPRVPVSSLAPRIRILSQADVGGCRGKLQAALADAEAASPTAPFTPSSMTALGGVLLQLGLVASGLLGTGVCASPACAAKPRDESE